MHLTRPDERYKDTYLEGLREFHAEGKLPGYDLPKIARNFRGFVRELRGEASPKNLRTGRVPSTVYWLMDGTEFIGNASLRHELNDWLREFGGHIGYGIRPSKRRQGYGRAILALTLEKARERGLSRVLVTCDEDNLGSRRIIEYNGGTLENAVLQEGTAAKKLRFWIETS